MITLSKLIIGSMLTGVVVLASAPTPSATPMRSGCGSNTAVRVRFLAGRELFRQTADSVQLADIGISVRPDSVWLISNTAVCDSLVTVHNGLLSGADTVFRVTVPNVVRMGSVYFLQVFPTGHPEHEHVFVYDTAYSPKSVVYVTLN